MKKILITGSAGFIGSALTIRLLEKNFSIVGLDNLNDYYDRKLKIDRLSRYKNNLNYLHEEIELEDREKIKYIFDKYNFDIVINLAAQAGVRYSIEQPNSYIDSNLIGFHNILEGCRQNNISHLLYASSSSVYGSNKNMPFSTHDNVDHPLSLYAATKKANELMAHSYSHLYQIPTTGLRFFTVYGPWGRPDMALFKFTKNILAGDEIDIFNNGNHKRDFTYIDDIVDGIINCMEFKNSTNSINTTLSDPLNTDAPWKIYNIGSNSPIDLMDFIKVLENNLGKEAKKRFLPLQPGDVPDTYADVKELTVDYNYRPKTTIQQGIKSFVEWYKSYYKI